MRDWRTRYAALPLRLMLGVGFIYHGMPKLFSTGGHQYFVATLVNLGIPLSGVVAWGVALLEVCGGVMLIAGAFVTIVGSLFVIEMLVALVKVHLANGFNFVHVTGMAEGQPVFGLPGYEVNLLYIAGLLALILLGGGALSVDRFRAIRKASKG
jgi:putative oxidoreductase